MVRILNLNSVPGACRPSDVEICVSNSTITALHARKKKYGDARLIRRHALKMMIGFGPCRQGWM